jgi:hypothetical protein
MKTFSKFLEMQEKPLDMEEDSDTSDLLSKALQKAIENHPSEVKEFLERLAKQDPDIQIELDNINHRQHMDMPKKPNSGAFGAGHVVVPNKADAMDGDLG